MPILLRGKHRCSDEPIIKKIRNKSDTSIKIQKHQKDFLLGQLNSGSLIYTLQEQQDIARIKKQKRRKINGQLVPILIRPMDHQAKSIPYTRIIDFLANKHFCHT